jgi:hypothetical protein
MKGMLRLSVAVAIALSMALVYFAGTSSVYAAPGDAKPADATAPAAPAANTADIGAGEAPSGTAVGAMVSST